MDDKDNNSKPKQCKNKWLLKKIRALIGFIFILTASSAWAVGANDGVYYDSSTGSLVQVSQNGNTLLAIGLEGLSLPSVYVYLPNGQYVYPGTFNTWFYYIGTLNADGVSGRLTGVTMYSACIGTVDFSISGSAVTVRLVSLVNTALATSQGVSCGNLQQRLMAVNNGTYTYRKIF